MHRTTLAPAVRSSGVRRPGYGVGGRVCPRARLQSFGGTRKTWPRHPCSVDRRPRARAASRPGPSSHCSRRAPGRSSLGIAKRSRLTRKVRIHFGPSARYRPRRSRRRWPKWRQARSRRPRHRLVASPRNRWPRGNGRSRSPSSSSRTATSSASTTPRRRFSPPSRKPSTTRSTPARKPAFSPSCTSRATTSPWRRWLGTPSSPRARAAFSSSSRTTAPALSRPRSQRYSVSYCTAASSTG